MRQIEIIRSGTWINADLQDINRMLNQTIEDFVNEGDRIINIETKTLDNGLSRFWIYIETTE